MALAHLPFTDYLGPGRAFVVKAPKVLVQLAEKKPKTMASVGVPAKFRKSENGGHGSVLKEKYRETSSATSFPQL
jgi:hypothetical protein